ncbi:MAG: dihydrolipoyllysine-residue acetyltransferase [Candidatus Eremiobacteraeota bacterium]|nr:dihydrolipoyllysine-residue acetyltransferase [Candidatus Eremiobacteraeota bacterium]
MSDLIDVRVPDIGDFKDIPVIEVLVKPGDVVGKEDPLVTLESEKATMDVPSPSPGVVKEIKLSVGDKVSQGAAILVLSRNGVQNIDEGSQVDETSQVMEGPATVEETPPKITELRVPDLGDFKDIPVIDVLVKPGEEIERDASLITLETEKATFEVPASSGGRIRDVNLKPGDKVSKDSLIATVQTTSPSQVDPVSAQSTGANAAQQSPRTQTMAAPGMGPGSDPATHGEVHASPSIRRFARDLGVELTTLRGSGPNNRITREDVCGFVKTAVRSGSAPHAPGAAVAPWPKIDFAQYGPVEYTALSRIKKISGPILHRNWLGIPHVTNNEDADITDLEPFREKLNAQNATSAFKVTMLAFLIRAVVAALQRFPDFNASLDDDRMVRKKYYNIGFAADTPDGLLVPVLKNADKKGILSIAQETAELAATARDGKLPISDMQGGSFTISSLGGIGGTYFTPIINAPEVAILGVCRAQLKPVWKGSTFVPRLMLPLSLSYDHRVIDGAAAARFNVYLAKVLADLRWTIV